VLINLQRIFPGLSGRLAHRLAVMGKDPICPAKDCAGHNSNLQPGRSDGRASDRPARRPEFTGGNLRGLGRAFVFAALLLTSLWDGTSRAASYGAIIPNTAHLTFDVGGVPQATVDSNTVTVTVRSPAAIEFLKYAPRAESSGEAVHIPGTSYDAGGGSYVLIPPPAPTVNPTVPLLGSPVYSLGETIYLRLTDLDQNLTAGLDTVIITITCAEIGDVETLQLSETEPGSGIFAGYLPTTTDFNALGANGKLVVTDQCHLQASYTDPLDMVKTIVDTALIDPYGIVFDSLTNQPVDGATVTLINDDTKTEAVVFADDGVSPYPATVTTGDTNYNFPPGGFRFPYILPGKYRLVVKAPAGYTAPSSRLDLIGSSSFTVVAAASFGAMFPVDPGPALRIDIPIDPLLSYLWLQKFVSDDVASVGDFLQYRLELENTNATMTAPAATISDRLPLGFRYQKGSARIAGARAADPAISSDGRTLTFQLGDLPPKGTLAVTYVVEVAAGAKAGVATNTARATDGNGAASNQARASVTVREEFFRDKTFLLGRVLTGSCNQTDAELKGLAGVRIYLEDGTYVVTDKDGKYHFEAVEPGTHVVQVDLATLPGGFEMIPCEQTSQFAGRSFSQFVDLRGGALWQVNFYTAPLPPATGEISLQLFSSLDGNIATLRALAKASKVPADNLRLTMMLPGAAEYLPGSARQNGEPIADPLAIGGAVNLRTPHLDADQSIEFVIQARLDGEGTDGELPAKALLTFDTPSAKNQRTPLAENRFRLSTGISKPSEEIRLYPHFPSFVAELQATDVTMLEQLATRLEGQSIARIDIVGHTDNQDIAPQSQRIFADNQALSEGRAGSVADFLRQKLNIPQTAITQRGMGETLPVADNASEEGRALNRRVELYVVTAAVSQPPRAEVTQPSSPAQSIPTTGAGATAADAKPVETTPPPSAKAPEMSALWLASLKPETRIIWPEQGYTPSGPSTKIMIQHPVGSRVELQINATPVNQINFDTSKPVPNSQFVVSSWEGIGISEGLNHIVASVIGSDETNKIVLDRELWFVTVPEKLTFIESESALLANGIQAPRIALRLTDRDSHPVFAGRKVEYQVSSPYRAIHDSAIEEVMPSASVNELITGADGLAYALLEPTTQVGEVTVTLLLPSGPQEIRAWLKPAPRDWILVGFAEGTAGYNTLSDNLVSAEEAGIDEHGYTDGRVKFFAKGAVKGEWLLTLAYDSDKPDLDGDSLQQIIDPDTYYPLYGDGTQQGYEAASARDIYVKLERDQFYALFGDMQTDLTQTELSQYSRGMNGFKSEMQGERFAYTVFAADTKQAFIKDELRGDGTSGRYALSHKALVINSEEVVIETRDRFHHERIVKEEHLSRHTDYDIDYDAGTLFFKRPIPSKDQDFNPIFIVVRYETEASAKANLNYGGRGAVKLLDQKVEVGASLVHEENGTAEGDLYGADVTVKLTPQTTLRAEVATTDVEEIDDSRKGDAYLAEVEHRGETLDGRVWFRQQDPKFGLGQQNGGESGTRTYGAEGAYRFNPQWSLAGEAWHEDNLGTDAKRDVATAEALYRAERYGLSAGVREARDKLEDGDKQISRQMLMGGDVKLFDKLTLRATHEQSLGGNDQNADFPTRTMIGADYRLTQSVSLFAEQEFTWGDQEDTEGTRVGIKATPWQGGEVSSSVEQQIDENGQRVFALFGLGQSWQVSQQWSIDASLDRSYTIKHPGNDRLNVNVPQASGSDDDFTAVSVGAAFKAEKWSWWNRLETRQGENEDKVGISSGLVGEVREGTAVSAKLMAFVTDSAGGSKSDEEEITLGMAYRPNQSKWIILERLDLSLANEDGDGTGNDSWRVVNHLHASFRANRQWQMSFYYGLKYVRENFDGDRYDGYTDMIAVEARYNINSKWDIGMHGAMLHSWNSNQFDYSLGADVGYLVMTNAWVSAGYNLVGFEDEDFSDANYTAEGPYVKFRMKFDQQSVKEAAAWLNK